MSIYEVKQNTAVTIPVGQFLDNTDVTSVQTGLTIAQADVQLSKHDSGTFAQKNESSNSSHISDGYYAVALNATDTNTTGTMLMEISPTGSFPITVTISVLTEYAWDQKYGTSYQDYNAPLCTGTIDSYTRNDDFTITSTTASATDDTYNGCLCEVIDVNDEKVRFWEVITDYTGSSKTLTLANESGIFTAASGDIVRIYRPIPADIARWLGNTPLDTQSGYLQVDAKRIDGQTTDASATVDFDDLANIDSDVDAIKAITDTLPLSAIADAVWDETATDHQSANTMGQSLELASSGDATAANQTTILNNLSTVDTVVDSVSNRIPDTLVAGSIKADILAINNDTNAAARLALSSAQMIPGTVETGTLSTTQMTTNLSETTLDHYADRLILFTTGDLAGQVSTVVSYSASGLITMSEVTEAPSDGDTFLLV